MTFVISHPLKTLVPVKVRQFASANAANDFRSSHLDEANYAVDKAADLKPVKDETLLAIVNKNNKVPVTKFVNRDAMQQAAFLALEGIAMPSDTKEKAKNPTAKELADMKAAGKLDKPKAEKVAKEKQPPKPRERKPVDYTPREKDTIKQVRAGTKVATMVDMLSAPDGTTLEALGKALSATGKPVDPRAWLGYDLNKVVGYGAKEDASGIIRIVLPKGMKAPLEHKVKEEPKPKAVKEPKAPKAAKAEEAVVVVEETPAKKAPAKKAAKGAKA